MPESEIQNHQKGKGLKKEFRLMEQIKLVQLNVCPNQIASEL